MKVNAVLTGLAVLIAAIVGVIFWASGFDALNIVFSELLILPMMVLLMGVSVSESSRIVVLQRTVVSVLLFITLIAQVVLGILDAKVVAYVICDGLLLIGLILGLYTLGRTNQ